MDGRSIFGLGELELFVQQGEPLRIRAEGPDAEEAVEALAHELEQGVSPAMARALGDALPVVLDFRELAEEILERGRFEKGDLEELAGKIERFRAALELVERYVLEPAGSEQL